MKLRFLGGARTIGCSCTLVQEGNTRILVDFGGDPAGKATIPFDARELEGIRALIITHAHFDHYGGLFDLFLDASKQKYLPPIICTESTRNFILKFGYKEWLHFGRGAHDIPPAEQNAFFKVLEQRLAPVPYGRPVTLDDFQCTLLPASHILGSAQVHVRSPFTEGLFTSDFKPSGTYLLRPYSPEQLAETFSLPISPDFIIVESTYGQDTRARDVQDMEGQLVNALRDVFEHGGNVLVPCFAIGRAQEFMTCHYRLIQSHPGIAPLNVYFIGSTTMATEMYAKALMPGSPEAVAFHEDARDLFKWHELPGIGDFDRATKALGARGDLRQKVMHMLGDTHNVFISSGGMLHGPALDVFKELKNSPHNALFMVGYQAEGTSGRALLDAAGSPELRKKLVLDGNKLTFDDQLHGKTAPRSRATPVTFTFPVFQFPLFSAHATFEEKMSYIKEIGAGRDQDMTVLATHGTGGNCEQLAGAINQQDKMHGEAPRIGQEVNV